MSARVWFLMHSASMYTAADPMQPGSSEHSTKQGFVKVEDHLKELVAREAEYEETLDILSKHVTALTLKVSLLRQQRDEITKTIAAGGVEGPLFGESLELFNSLIEAADADLSSKMKERGIRCFT